MATRTLNIEHKTTHGDRHVHIASWTGLLQSSSDVGAQLAMPASADRSVQVVGTLGVGGTLRIEGSNDGGTTWHVLHDPQGGDLDFTALGIEAISEMTELIRPRVTAGDGSTDFDVYIIIRRN